MSLPKILLLGYGGANNTGAEIRMLTIIDDLRAVFGHEVPLTLATMNPDKTRRVVREDAQLRIARLPYLFPLEVWRLTRAHDLVLLVEGSTFKDNWSSALLYLFLWTAWTAKWHGRHAIAYAVDAGHMGRLNRWLARVVCNRMDLLVLRTEAARRKLLHIGVAKPMLVTTDTAFQFETPPTPRRASTVVGLAPIEFHHWPVRARLWGPREQCYHWPYYYSWNAQRRAASAALVEAWVQLIRHVVVDRGWHIKLIAMEELDTVICNRILAQLPAELRARVQTHYAGAQTPQTLVAELRALDYLVTSRYHACVLSMQTAVPQVALHHDERLPAIYHEMGLSRHALPHDVPQLGMQLQTAFERLVDEAAEVRSVLRQRLLAYYLPRCLSNREVLADWARRELPGAQIRLAPHPVAAQHDPEPRSAAA